jgi:hypothetical protein
VRFTTAAGLVNELVEAKHQLQLRRVLARSRYDLIAIDEVGYVPLAEVGAELLLQVVAERAEKAAVILTNQPAVFRVNPRNPQCVVVQSATRSHHGPGANSGNRDRIISLPPHGREAEEGSQSELSRKAVEMPGRGKGGKPNPRFFTLSTALGNPCRDSPIPTASTTVPI